MVYIPIIRIPVIKGWRFPIPKDQGVEEHPGSYGNRCKGPYSYFKGGFANISIGGTLELSERIKLPEGRLGGEVEWLKMRAWRLG